MAKAKKDTRGRKPNSAKGKEVKKSYPAYLYPTIKKEIVESDGSLTKALEIRHEQIKSIQSSKPKTKK